MERYKIFEGIISYMRGIVDYTMDAVNRNIQKIGNFFTSTYGVNMQDSLDALQVYDDAGTIYVKAGWAISPLYNLIINSAAESIQTLINDLFGSPPDEGSICYVFVTVKEDYDPTSDASGDFLPGYSDSNPYYKWNIGHEFKIQDNDPALPDSDSVLLAKMTYTSGVWVIEDKRVQTQFSISFGNTELIYHLLSAHTACLYPDGTIALTPTKAGNSVEVEPLGEDDYLYNQGQIYRQVSPITIGFTGADEDGWYYIYIDNGDLAKVKVADEYASFPHDTKQYFVIAFVEWTDPNLGTPTDERPAYFLPTNAKDVRNEPANSITAKNVQDAIDQLELQKLSLTGGGMSGILNMAGNRISNIGDLTSFAAPGGGDNECKIVLGKPEYYVNLFDLLKFDNTKIHMIGSEISLADIDTLNFTGGNIGLDSTKTVDGIDVSEYYKRGYAYVVDRDGTGAPDEKKLCGLEYALVNATAGQSIFVKKFDYTLSESRTLNSGVTMIGESISSTKISSSYTLTCNIWSSIKNLFITGGTIVLNGNNYLNNMRSEYSTIQISGSRCILNNIYPNQTLAKSSLTINDELTIVSNGEFGNIIINSLNNYFSKLKTGNFTINANTQFVSNLNINGNLIIASAAKYSKFENIECNGSLTIGSQCNDNSFDNAKFASALSIDNAMDNKFNNFYCASANFVSTAQTNKFTNFILTGNCDLGADAANNQFTNMTCNNLNVLSDRNHFTNAVANVKITIGDSVPRAEENSFTGCRAPNFDNTFGGGNADTATLFVACHADTFTSGAGYQESAACAGGATWPGGGGT